MCSGQPGAHKNVLKKQAHLSSFNPFTLKVISGKISPTLPFVSCGKHAKDFCFLISSFLPFAFSWFSFSAKQFLVLPFVLCIFYTQRDTHTPTQTTHTCNTHIQTAHTQHIHSIHTTHIHRQHTQTAHTDNTRTLLSLFSAFYVGDWTQGFMGAREALYQSCPSLEIQADTNLRLCRFLCCWCHLKFYTW